MASASITTAPRSASMVATVLLPEPTPPVRPTFTSSDASLPRDKPINSPCGPGSRAWQRVDQRTKRRSSAEQARDPQSAALAPIERELSAGELLPQRGER